MQVNTPPAVIYTVLILTPLAVSSASTNAVITVSSSVRAHVFRINQVIFDASSRSRSLTPRRGSVIPEGVRQPGSYVQPTSCARWRSVGPRRRVGRRHRGARWLTRFELYA